MNSKCSTFHNEDSKSEFVQYSSKLGRRILYSPTKSVNNIMTSRIQKIIPDMKNCLQNNGIGLAANQIGKSLQVFIIEFHANYK